MHMYAKCDKICHVVQELCTFSLSGNGRTNRNVHENILVGY